MRLICLVLLLTWLSQTVPAQERIFYEHWHLRPDGLGPGNSGQEAEAQWGAGAAAVGDFNQDGWTDLVVGEAGQSDRLGQAWTLMLDSSGQVLQALNWQPKGLTPGGQFGRRVEALGDWDGDGVPDVAITEPRGELAGQPYGCVWLCLLQPNGDLKEALRLNVRSGPLLGKISNGVLFGTDLCALGDIDGNGQRDLVVGAPGHPSKHTGEVYLLLMQDPRKVLSHVKLSDSHPELSEQLRRGDRWGYAVEDAGDLDGNGIPDLFIGAPRDDGSGLDRGALYVCFLGEGGQVIRWRKILNDQGGFDVYLGDDDRWASSLARVPGWNSDSLTALATGVPQDDDAAKDRGGIYVLYLNREGQVRRHHKISQTTPNFEGEFQGRAYHWATSLNPAGDLDQDGREDLLVSGDEHGSKGSLWVLRPTQWPDRLKEELTWAEGAFAITAEDSARIYTQAETAADSARIDSLYDLSSYAPSHIIFLLDVSASMDQSTKLPLLREAFINLLPFLRPEDKVSIITYSGKPSVQLAGITAEERDLIAGTLDRLVSQGDTKPRKALEMAYELAQEQLISGGNNRIIFATDGGFGFSELDRPLERHASPDVPMSVFYFGKVADWQVEALGDIARRGYGNLAHITGTSVSEALLQEVKVIRVKE